MQCTTIKLGSALALVAALACGKGEDAAPQPNGGLRVPQLGDDGAPLDLTSTPLSVTYDGTLLIWDEANVTPAQIAEVSVASAKGRAYKAKHLAYVLGELMPRAQALPAHGEKITAHRDAADQRAREALDADELRERRAELLKGWFDGAVDALVDAEPALAAHRDALRRQFARYCDAKLWQLGLSRLLASHTFSDRPTPMMACESYYEERKYFEYGGSFPECDRPETPGNAFQCIWLHGILKSPLVAELEAATSDADGNECRTSGRYRVDAMRALARSAAFRNALGDVGASPLAETSYRGALLAGWDSVAVRGGVFDSDASRYADAADLFSCRHVFFFKHMAADAPADSELAFWGAGPAGSVARSLEGKDRDVAALWLGVEANAANAALVDRVADALTRPLLHLGERGEYATDGIDAAQQYALSLSDYYFNVPSGLTIVKSGLDAEHVQFVDAMREIKEIEPRWSAADQAKMKELMDALETAKTELGTHQKKALELQNAIVDASMEGLRAATAEGATLYFNGIQIRVASQGNGIDAFVGIGGAAQPWRGCSDFVELVPCATPLPVATSPLKTLVYDAIAGALRIEIALDAPETQGFAPVAWAPGAKFSELDVALLSGRTLRLDVVPNRLEDPFRFVTGKAQILDEAGKTVYEGSFSGDNHGAVLSAK